MPLEVGEMADIIREDSGTTAEIRLLCADLQVLGRNEFKALLKWRLKVKKAIDVRVKEAAAAEGGDSDDEVRALLKPLDRQAGRTTARQTARQQALFKIGRPRRSGS